MHTYDFILKLVTQFGGGAILTLIGLFIGKVVVSGDLKFTSRAKKQEQDRLDRIAEDERCRTYEIAYRFSVIWYERLAYLVGAAIMAHKKGNTQVALGMLEASCDFLVEERDGQLRVKDMPDFFEEAREEVINARPKAE